jgi:tetratricopeptide (TPR) repeat protein
METSAATPLRMEHALRLVPDLSLLGPLRVLLAALSKPDMHQAWSGSSPYLTLGKRGIEPAEIRGRLDDLVRRIASHVAAQYDAVLTVLDSYHRGAPTEAVGALLESGRREERVGRPAAARAWYAVATEFAETLPDRRPEIASLLLLAAVDRKRGALSDAARRYQRALVLAEAEFDDSSAIISCVALGEISLTLQNFDGARSWYTRGLRQSQGGGNQVMAGRVLEQFATLALREGRVGDAPDFIRRARTCLAAAGEPADRARLLRTEGLMHEHLNDRSAAADYREALMWALQAAEGPDLQLSIRLHLARFELKVGRPLEAEEEMRRAEQVALAEGLPSWLVRVYLLLGHARAKAQDENGFVFFEQAIELCRSLECSSLLEAGAYKAYGEFRTAVGDPDGGRAYLDRAADILRPLGAPTDLVALPAILLA